MLRHPARPPLLTCIPTGVALLAGGLVFATLHLWLTALTQAITGLQWLALSFKKGVAVPPRDSTGPMLPIIIDENRLVLQSRPYQRVT
jgi:hypothetical protein